PAWHASQGLSMEQALLNILTKYGYTKPGAKIYVQCFEPASLQKLHKLSPQIPLIQLISANWSYASMWTKSGLDQIAIYAAGIGPSKTIIEKNPAFVQWAHDRGLVVHPYVFRRDELPSKYSSLEQEMKQFYFTYNVDGLFTDFVDVAARVLRGH
ncbi:MAG TPA: glycerophosphodiester phosphodiesterase, partial [Candidatus Acetothermia bacterium]|nr:glycerophosphodiester phosphodiesterase [Candidatus Acetothermia bacterium]